jgi:hypothetical protein
MDSTQIPSNSVRNESSTTDNFRRFLTPSSLSQSLQPSIEADEGHVPDGSIGPGESPASSNPRKRRPYGKRLTPDQELLIFRHALRHQEYYEKNERDRKRKFWVAVSQSLMPDLGRAYAWNSIKKRVEDHVRRRKTYLEQLKTDGPLKPRTALEAAVDEWIKVIGPPRTDDDNSQLFRRALNTIAEYCESDSNRQLERAQDDIQTERMRIGDMEKGLSGLEKRLDSQEEKLDKILEILRGQVNNRQNN